jgi:hypothetical protein
MQTHLDGPPQAHVEPAERVLHQLLRGHAVPHVHHDACARRCLLQRVDRTPTGGLLVCGVSGVLPARSRARGVGRASSPDCCSAPRHTRTRARAPRRRLHLQRGGRRRPRPAGQQAWRRAVSGRARALGALSSSLRPHLLQGWERAHDADDAEEAAEQHRRHHAQQGGGWRHRLQHAAQRGGRRRLAAAAAAEVLGTAERAAAATAFTPPELNQELWHTSNLVLATRFGGVVVRSGCFCECTERCGCEWKQQGHHQHRLRGPVTQSRCRCERWLSQLSWSSSGCHHTCPFAPWHLSSLSGGQPQQHRPKQHRTRSPALDAGSDAGSDGSRHQHTTSTPPAHNLLLQLVRDRRDNERSPTPHLRLHLTALASLVHRTGWSQHTH